MKNGRAGTITINGGTIEAISTTGGAGIGSGETGPGAHDGGGTITINGGKITAEGKNSGAGIGTAFAAGYNETDHIGDDGTVITITGGKITAKGDIGAADIGGGSNSDSGRIRIDSSLRESMKGMTIGKGNNGRVNDVEYLALPKHIPDNIPDLPSALVKTPAIVRKPVYGDVVTLHKANNDTSGKLSNISQFYNSEGVFIVSQPQTITITQGDGQTASITLYASDTIYDVAEKINNVIADTFGHAQHTDNPAKFCTISDGTEGTSESIFEAEPIYDENGNNIGRNIHSTMLIRSAIPGKSGELSFSGDEEILRALGLNTIREASESKFTASIYDAHSGKVIVSGEKLTGNVIHDALTGVDIEFSDMAGIKSSWDENSKRFIFTGGEKYTALLHLKDNGITFHTGANMGEDFSVQLGDMSCSALGINRVNVTDRESASRSISTIDRAITRVSSQRANIGAYINGLEHTMTNLTTTSANLTEAESRIRDTDMAKTMMDFVRLQILNQSGTSMLSQANQIPRSVLSILGN